MKKASILVTAMMAVLLCGCRSNGRTDISAYGDAISKAQEIVVVSFDTSEIVETITEKEEIENFVLALGIDEWKLRTLPDGAAEIGSFELSQEETVKFGQGDMDGALYDIATITLYEDGCIGFAIDGLVMTFAVSEDTDGFLKGYFEETGRD